MQRRSFVAHLILLTALCAGISSRAWGEESNCIAAKVELAAANHGDLDALLFKLYQRGSERESAVVAKYWIYDGLSDTAIGEKLSLTEAELQEAKDLALKRLLDLEPNVDKRNLAKLQAEILMKLHRDGRPPTPFDQVRVPASVPATVGGKQLPLRMRVAIAFKIESMAALAEPQRTYARILRGWLLDSKLDADLQTELGMSEKEFKAAKWAANISFKQHLNNYPELRESLSDVLDLKARGFVGDHRRLDTLLFGLYGRATERESAVVLKYWIYDGMDDPALCKKLSLSPAELQEAKQVAWKRLLALESDPERKSLIDDQVELIRRTFLKDRRPIPIPRVSLRKVPAQVAGRSVSLATRVFVEVKIEYLERAEEPIRTYGRILRGVLLDLKSDGELRLELGMNESDFARDKRLAGIRLADAISQFPDIQRDLAGIANKKEGFIEPR